MGTTVDNSQASFNYKIVKPIKRNRCQSNDHDQVSTISLVIHMKSYLSNAADLCYDKTKAHGGSVRKKSKDKGP